MLFARAVMTNGIMICPNRDIDWLGLPGKGSLVKLLYLESAGGLMQQWVRYDSCRKGTIEQIRGLFYVFMRKEDIERKTLTKNKSQKFWLTSAHWRERPL